jgi:hypothetical protein
VRIIKVGLTVLVKGGIFLLFFFAGCDLLFLGLKYFYFHYYIPTPQYKTYTAMLGSIHLNSPGVRYYLTLPEIDKQQL